MGTWKYIAIRRKNGVGIHELYDFEGTDSWTVDRVVLTEEYECKKDLIADLLCVIKDIEEAPVYKEIQDKKTGNQRLVKC